MQSDYLISKWPNKCGVISEDSKTKTKRSPTWSGIRVKTCKTKTKTKTKAKINNKETKHTQTHN